MAYYALVASLPSIQIGDEPPMDTEAFIKNCAQWTTEREVEILQRILLKDTEISPCALCRTWDDIEIQIRNAIATYRGQKLGIDYKAFLQSHDGFSGQIETLVTAAFTRNNPAELEKAIDHVRWTMANELVGQESFGFKKLLAYGIQLKIVERWHRMDPTKASEKIEAIITKNTEKPETV